MAAIRLAMLAMHLCTAGAAEAPAAAGEAGPEAAGAETRHFVVLADERVIGVAIERTGEGAWKGKRSIRRVTRETYRFAASGSAAETAVERTQHLDPDTRAALFLEEREEAGGRTVTYRAEVAGDAILFGQEIAGGEPRTKRVAADGPVFAELDGELLAARGLLKPGGELEAYVVAPRQSGLARQRVRVMGRRVIEGRPAYLLRVEDANEPDAGWELRCDNAGRTVELFAGAVGRRLVPKEEAVLPAAPARLARRALLFDRPLRRRRLTERLVLEVRVADDLGGRLIPSATYQEVSFESGVYRVSLRALRPDGTLPQEELTEEERAQCLAPSLRVESDAPEIANLAREIVGGEPSPLARVYRLARWVHRRLRKEPLPQAEGSALECLRARRGDCTEHAALFVALCRAAGLPARGAWGLVAGEEGLAFHAWAEAYAGGRWIPVDAALGRFGVPALYLLLGRGADRGRAETALARLYSASTVRVLAAEP